MMNAVSSTTLRWTALPPLWIIVLVIAPLVILGVRWIYRREGGRTASRLRPLMMALRVGVIALALTAFFGPYAETIEGDEYKRHLIVAVDTSRSMHLRDANGYASDAELAAKIREAAGMGAATDLATKRRIEIIAGVLKSKPEFIERLSEKFELHLYRFDSGVAGLFEPEEGMTPGAVAEAFLARVPSEATGKVTRIGSAIETLVRQFDARNEPVAGILMFTDGRHTGGAPLPVEEARRAAEGTRSGIPIFPVAIGDPATAINIGVSRVDAPEVALAGDQVAFTVSVYARGLAGREADLRVHVLNEDGTVAETLPIEVEPFALPSEDEPAKKISFRHRFSDPGRYRLRVGVDPYPGEAVHSDNYQEHILRIVQLKMRVLYVVARPNYTYRFLKEALFRAENIIDAQILLLSAEAEWPQEASRANEPLLVFPRTKRELAQYDVIILMDVDPDDARISGGDAIVKKEILGGIAEWVKQGGGLVLHAGRHGNIPDRLLDTPMMPLLPVVPHRVVSDVDKERRIDIGQKKRFTLTDAGAAHPVMRVLSDPREARQFWDGSDYETTYCWYAAVEKAKSSATVLAVRRGLEGKQDPLIALLDYGLGKVLWLGTDELWRMRRGVENLYYWGFWSGVIRHLATYRLLGGNKRIKIWIDRADGRYQVGDSVRVEAKFLDENFEPVVPDDVTGDATRTIKLRGPDGVEQDVVLNAEITDPPEGLFWTRITAGTPGTYSLLALAPGEDEPAEETFVVEDTTAETKDPLLDAETLEAIASASRGAVLQPHEFHLLLEDQRVPHGSIMRSGEPHRTDLWDRAWVLWLFVGLLAAEWILRRMNLLL